MIDVLSWNINFRTTASLDPIVRLDPRPTVVALQEVANRQLAAVRDALKGLGYTVAHSCNLQADEKRYGNIVAIRDSKLLDRLEIDGFPWPQLVLGTRIVLDERPITVVNVHIPNGSGNGWRKIDSFESLRESIAILRGQPLILAGDFNEPMMEPLQAGHVVTWGQEHDGKGWTLWDRWTFDGVTDSGERWDNAVRWFFDSPQDSNIRTAFWDVRPGEMEPSHLCRGSGRWFDHIFVSPHFRVDSCRYLHSWREEGYSDHSPIYAQLSLRE